MPWVGSPANKKIPGFAILPPVCSWVDEEVHKGGFANKSQ
jgi:hypothetical protein